MRDTGPSARSLAERTLSRVERHMSPGASLTAKILGRGAIEATASGATITLSDGRRVLDFGSYGITLLGHRHPAVLAALSQALETMPTASRVLANPNTAAFAEELADRCGGPLQRVWLGSDGSDAVEVSLKLARRGTGRLRVLVAEGAFHGKTLGALALTSNPMFRVGLDPLLGAVSQLPRDDPEAVQRETQRGDVAALIFEPIQGEGGVRVLERHVLERWTADAHTAGTFVVSDEIQVGLGRCGPFSPSIAADLEPDAVLFGKALGGGLLPLSAMVATDSFAAPLISDPTWHTTTFSGHPLSCAAGVAALGALEDLSAQGSMVGETIGAGLNRLACERPELITEIRGRGLIWGIEFATPGAAGAALVDFAQSGLLVSPCLSSNTTIRLLPPMVATRDQAEAALEIVAATLPSLTGYL